MTNPHLLEAALTNGALSALSKNMASGDVLEKAVLKAMAKFTKESKDPSHQ